MRIILILTCLFSFTLSSLATWADTDAHVAMEQCHDEFNLTNHEKTTHHHDHCGSDSDLEHKDCDNCCCMHTHTVALISHSSQNNPTIVVSDEVNIRSASFYSFNPSTLLRPPRS